VENLGRRPHIRRVLNVTVTYDTPVEKVEEAVGIIKRILGEEGIVEGLDVGPFSPKVMFDEFNAESLNIRVTYWFRPGDPWGQLEHAERFNLRLLRAYNEAGIEFAFPTRTLFVAGDAKRQLAVKVGNGDGEE
jgi:MscS family membrane protein